MLSKLPSILAACFVVSSLVFTGCDSDPLGRVEVDGTVTVDGTPLKKGEIMFIPQEPSSPTDSLKIVDGAFKGPVLPGSKQVQIRGYEEVTSDLSADSPEAGVSFNKQILPAKFNDNSELTETIPSSESLKYELSTK
ncbi:hypothetical protein FF011L_22850 [Roseimaritima multifibrata]|uniref:Carboxypeptidase regulatory-like domain-containing protein n=1 Tax=Roseimaritima multifibrata TaxID=1930274 RepID=A0A517MF52_9BACT|nr:hypothetical protein [Roseimaritima multifibrata]QDS93515.1 hypothetical protein FF011L_22850 [Roseimaritima multifibrata]